MKRSRWHALIVMLVGGVCRAQSPPILSLEDAVAIALKANRQVQISALDVTKAGQATAETRTARLPRLSSYFLAGVPLNPISFTVPQGALGVFPSTGAIPAQDSSITTPRRLTGLIYATASQPISQLFKINLAIRASRLGEQLAREFLRQQKQDAAHQVRSYYYQIVETQTQIVSAESSLKYLTELSALVDRNLAQETALKSESLTVKAKLSQMRYQLLQLHDALDTRKEALNRVLGRDLNAEFNVEAQPTPSSEELDLAAARKQALDRRSEIRKAHLQSEKAELEIRRERAEYLPDLSAQLSYLSLPNVNFLPQNIAHAGFVLEWQPFDWGQKRYHTEQLRTAAKQATLTEQDAGQQILADVNFRYRKLVEARMLLDVQAATQETEREKLRVLMNRYEQKSALFADVLQQQSSLANADSQYQQAVAGFWTAKADFEHALGEDY